MTSPSTHLLNRSSLLVVARQEDQGPQEKLAWSEGSVGNRSLVGTVLFKELYLSPAEADTEEGCRSLGPGPSPSLVSVKKCRGAGNVVLQENWTQAD